MANTPAPAQPAAELLNPTNHSLTLIDYEGQMGFAVRSISMYELRVNVGLIAGTAKIFNIPTIVTTVAENTFSGPVFPELEEAFPKATSGYIDRTTMNTWEDVPAWTAITGKAKKKLVMAGLWTGVCIVGPALSAKEEGYEVYVITDACGDVSTEAHERAIQRMVQCGIKPITSIQYLLELQRDWARSETYAAVTTLIKKFAGSYGLGIQYAHEMIKH